jgi:alpha-beta hydrolase superfamily lysophospholipase
MTLAASTTTQKEANDGTQLLVRRWPVTGDPWARMLLVHGAGEHSGRYERRAACSPRPGST